MWDRQTQAFRSDIDTDAWQRFLKIAFLALTVAYYPLIAFRYILFPDFGVGPAQENYVTALIMLVAIPALWMRLANPDLFWQYLICIVATVMASIVAFIGGTQTFWIGPLLAAAYALLISYPVVTTSDKSREVWGLSVRQRGLAALFVSAIIGIGLIAWFSHEGEAREAHLLLRTIFAALLVMTLWSTAIILTQKRWRMEDVRVVVLRVFAALLVLLATVLIFFHLQLSQYSATDLEGEFAILRAVGYSALLAATAFYARNVIGRGVAIATAILWATMISTNQSVANIPVLSAIALFPLAIRFPNWWAAGGFWAVILAILAFGLGITELLFVMHGLVATVIFASSYWLGLRLEAFSDAAGVEEEAAKEALLARPVLGRRSLGIGLAAGSAVLLIGGGLIYADYSVERELARTESRRVAERLTVRISTELEERERIAEGLSRLPLERITSQAEFEQATDLVVNINPEHSVGWAPQGILSFSNPLKGNEAAIGLDLLAMDERKEAFEHVIDVGVPHWLGPYDLARGGQGLLYVMPIYRSGAEPSRQSFVGFLSILEDLHGLVAKQLADASRNYGLRVVLTNPTIQGQEARSQLIFGSADGDEGYAEFGSTAGAIGSPDDNNEALTITVEAQPRSIEVLDALPARLQGLLIMVLLLGGGAAIVSSSRRLVQAQIVAQERQLTQIFKGSEAAQILVSRAGEIIEANQAAVSLFKYTREELLKLNVDELVPKSYREHHAQLRESHFAAGCPRRRASDRELEACDKTGKIFPIQLGLARIDEEHRELALATVIDISAIKIADQARQQFISNISHDLRTPLSVVIGAANALESELLAETGGTRLKRLQQASNVLYSLVNDVLDWSKIEAGEIDLEHEPLSLVDVFETIDTVMGEVAKEKGITLTCDKAPDLPDYVVGDATRLQQILFNLTSNAIKFTDEGEVKLNVSKVAPHNPAKVRLRIDVSDSGVGISPEDQKLLFHRFSQVDKSATRRFQGTGLGLSIVSQLAELMDGSVEVKSKPGVGSTFSVELELDLHDPLHIAWDKTDGDTAAGKANNLSGLRILMVDDNQLIIEELAEMLEWSFDAKVSTCRNGQEALEWLEQNHEEVDLVMMDVHMPVMDGITAVTIIRSDPVLKKIPVIAMTAGATKTIIDELLAAGMTDYITKPFNKNQLEDLLLKHHKP